MGYNELFREMVEFMEFSVVKSEGGLYALSDWQRANLGDIEGERFEDARGIVERMDAYIHDYMLDDEVWGSYASVGEALKRKRHPLWKFFDLIANHIDEVDLSKVAI